MQVSLDFESYLPTESRLLLFPELLAPLNVTAKLFGLENWPLDGLLSLFSFSTSDLKGLFGVSYKNN